MSEARAATAERAAGDDRPARRALVVRLSAVGDIVHTLPVAAALKGAGWSVAWLAQPGGRALLEHNPAVDTLVVAPSSRRFRLRDAGRALEELHALRSDVAIDVQGLWKSAAWARLAGAERIVGFAARSRREGSSSFLAHETVVPPRSAAHVVDRNLALLAPLGIDAIGLRAFPLPPLDPAEGDVLAAVAAADPELAAVVAGGGFVLAHPGGGWESKLWPAARWGELAKALAARGVPTVVSWGPGEEALVAAVAEAAEGTARIAPPTSLLELAALARRARAVVGADTGPVHLAAAAGARVVGLYGPTDPRRNGPLAAAGTDGAVRVLRRVPPCAPCHQRVCAEHHGVVGEIRAVEVIRELEDLGSLDDTRVR